MSTARVKRLQRDLNTFTNKYLEKVAPIRVDGKKGFATNRRIQTAKFYLGYTGKPQRRSSAPPLFRERLRRPKSRLLPSAMRKRGAERRRDQRKRANRAPTHGVTTFDGRPVAAWLKPYLEWARRNGWRGTLNSGWRDPVYSEQLCYRMCGAPSCPGRCAGRASNHAGSTKPSGAVDVSDYVTFGTLMRRCPYSPRIFNALGARDPVHFSASGR